MNIDDPPTMLIYCDPGLCDPGLASAGAATGVTAGGPEPTFAVHAAEYLMPRCPRLKAFAAP
jgi:hypothetical protein